MKKALLSMAVLGMIAGTSQAAPSWKEMGKVWDAQKSGDSDTIIAAVDTFVAKFEKQAKKIQSNLTELPKISEKKDLNKFGALNDVAQALLLKGAAQEASGDKDGARTTYNRIINEFSYGQSWDKKGWAWQPAGAAKKKLAKLGE